jgi:hypothetical protein
VRAPVNAIQIVSTSPTPPVALDAPLTITGIGAAQGLDVRDGKVYLYGDASTGVVREYDVTAGNALTYTGRQVRLTAGGSDLVSHPTGSPPLQASPRCLAIPCRRREPSV